MNTTIRKYSSRAFIQVVTPLDFVGQFRIYWRFLGLVKFAFGSENGLEIGFTNVRSCNTPLEHIRFIICVYAIQFLDRFCSVLCSQARAVVFQGIIKPRNKRSKKALRHKPNLLSLVVMTKNNLKNNLQWFTRTGQRLCLYFHESVVSRFLQFLFWCNRHVVHRSTFVRWYVADVSFWILHVSRFS